MSVILTGFFCDFRAMKTSNVNPAYLKEMQSEIGTLLHIHSDPLQPEMWSDLFKMTSIYSL